MEGPQVESIALGEIAVKWRSLWHEPSVERQSTTSPANEHSRSLEVKEAENRQGRSSKWPLHPQIGAIAVLQRRVLAKTLKMQTRMWSDQI